MGLFLSLMVIPGGKIETVAPVLKQLSANNLDWALMPENCSFAARERGVMVLLNDGCAGFDDLAKSCSEKLPCPVLLSYIYDGDFWGYFMFDQGREVDCYCAVPDYFEPLSEQELRRQAGKPDVIAAYFSVAPERIRNYLQRWTEELESAEESYAYEGDEYPICADWQMVDFLKAIGWPYEW